MHPLRTLMVATVGLLVLTASANAAPRVSEDMYGKRYCEYLALKGTPPKLTADVWNTFGLNTCPPARWKASDPVALAGELDAFAVVLNGPRYWLMDRGSITLARGLGQVKRFGNGLEMRRIAQVEVPTVGGVPGTRPYRQTVVRRTNTFTWSKRHPVHELVAPGGSVYVMQTYAQIADPTLTLRGLRGLGKRLDLPRGWRFRTRRLTRDLSLTTTGRAVVIQDDLQNTYQLKRR